MSIPAGPDIVLTPWQQFISGEISIIMKSGLYNDTEMLCADGAVDAPRCMVALAYPSLHSVLRGREDRTITLILPQFRKAEVEQRLSSFLRHSLQDGDVHLQSSDEDDDQDKDFVPEDLVELSDTEILAEDDEMQEELRNLSKEDTTSCTCCSACKRRRGKTGRPPGSFSDIKTIRGKQKRVTKFLKGIHKGKEGNAEALAVLRRLHREHPETKGNSVSNLSLLSLIKTMRLSYNQVFQLFKLKYLKP